jgi:hypothetical protein
LLTAFGSPHHRRPKGKTIRSQKNIDAESKSGLDTHMKTKTSSLTLTLCFAAAAVCVAADPLIGTWKLNEAKSKLDPEGPKNHTVVYKAAGDKVNITVDGTDPEGKATHNQWTGKFDGKDYPVTGEAASDARSYTKVNDRTVDFTAKKGGKTVGTGRIVVSVDGKSRTVTVSGTNPKGKKFKTTAVYDKQ